MTVVQRLAVPVSVTAASGLLMFFATGLGGTVTAGIVSATGRTNVGFAEYEDFIQTDAAINVGNSGGPLVDAEGRLVGINTWIISRSGGSQGLGFAVPINMARYAMERLISEGKVTRGYLGLALQQEMTLELAKEFKLPSMHGALVTTVDPDSPAGKAGIPARGVPAAPGLWPRLWPGQRPCHR